MERTLPILIGLLIAATALAIAAKRARIPYNVALVVGGLVLAMAHVLPGVPALEPEVVFLLCLPLLLFEGGITADLDDIRRSAVPLAVVSTAGMAISIVVTGALLQLILGLGWGPSLLLGATLSVTDTVSILFAFRRVQVPPRLAGLMEGESLFNDGTALVAFAAIAAVVATGETPTAIGLLSGVAFATAGGAAIGLAAGLTAGAVIRRVHDPLAEIMATAALAFASYAAARALHPTRGKALLGAPRAGGETIREGLPPESRIALGSFWEYAAFGVNTFLFLEVGLATSPDSLVHHAGESVLAVACVFAGRAAGVYLPFALLRLFRPAEAPPVRWQHVFVIGNVKGALSIALALGLPAGVPHRELLVDVAFAVTFVSLVGQGLLLPVALRRLGLVETNPAAATLAEQQGRLVGARAARAELEALHAQGLVPRGAYDQLRSEYQVTIAAAERELRKLQEQHLALGARALLATRRRLVDAERTALLAASRSGLLSDEVASRLLGALDARMLSLDRVLAGEDVRKKEER